MMQHRKQTAGSRHRAARDDGAALLLAIGFVVMIGSIGAGLASLVTSGVNNRITLEQVRDRQYAAEGAIELSINDTLSDITGQPCAAALSASKPVTLNSFDIHVDRNNACSVVRGGDAVVVVQRNVIFTACLETGSPCTPEDVIVRAQINFAQVGTNPVTKTSVQSWNVGS